MSPVDLSPSSELPTRTAASRRATTISVPSAVAAYLVVLGGGQAGRRYEVGDELLLGRGGEAQVVLDDPEVSRKHCRIRREPLGYIVEDLGSRNRTLLNDSPLTHPRALAFGDKLQLGPRVLLRFMSSDAERELVRRERLEALGRISAGVAHDINNMLAAMLSSLDYLDDTLAPEARKNQTVSECLDDLRAAVSQAAALTPRLLTFGREGRVDSVDVSGLCREVVQLVQRTFERSIEITAELEPELVVRGDRVGLHQVLTNLCLNARDAMPNGGRLQVTARTEPQYEGGPAVVLSVSDSGAGVSDDAQARIFDPFFTTKAKAGGLGLGLATVREVVTAHGGHVEIDCRPDRGTTFVVYLPMLAGGPRYAQPTANGRKSVGAPGGGVVMVVDDENTVRRAFSRLLRGGGHEVLLAPDGVTALEMYANAERRPDVVLLDLDMPGLRGDEVQRRLRRINPDVRVLFVTGHYSPDVERRVRADGALGFLAKPVTAGALLAAVAEAMK